MGVAKRVRSHTITYRVIFWTVIFFPLLKATIVVTGVAKVTGVARL